MIELHNLRGNTIAVVTKSLCVILYLYITLYYFQFPGGKKDSKFVFVFIVRRN